MADNVTIKDSAEVDVTVATHDLGSGVHASKVILVDTNGSVMGYSDDEIVFPVAVTEDIFHYAIHEGVAYTACSYAASGDIHICFKTPAAGSPTTFFHILMDVSGEKNVALEVWEGVTAGAAGAKVAYCKNRHTAGTSAVRSGNALTVGSYDEGTAFSSGTRIYEEFQAKGSGGRDATYELLLAADTVYGFKVDNIDGNDCGLNLVWFEVPAAS